MSNSAKEFNPLPVIYEALEKDAKERASWMPPQSIARSKNRLPGWIFENSPRLKALYRELDERRPVGEEFYSSVVGYTYQAIAEIVYTEEVERRTKAKHSPEKVLPEPVTVWMMAQLRAERHAQFPTLCNALRLQRSLYRPDQIVIDADGKVTRVIEHTLATDEKYYNNKIRYFNRAKSDSEEPETFRRAKLVFTSPADAKIRAFKGVPTPKSLEHVTRTMVNALAKRFYLSYIPDGKSKPMIELYSNAASRFGITEAELLAHLPELQEGEIITNTPSARLAYSY